MDAAQLDGLIQQALDEDVGSGDVTTTRTVPEDSTCTARLVAKQDGVLSGMIPFRRVFERADCAITSWTSESDGMSFKSGTVLAEFSGNTRGILTGERTALNFLQHLTGVATLTAAYVRAVEGTAAKVYDTRKTTPLFRTLEKEAVVHGGGTNHRYGLYDAVLIKENHVQAAGGIGAALAKAKSGNDESLTIEIEVRDLDECDTALEHGADIIMLDNMSNEDMTEAVRRRGDRPVKFEASGNVNLERICSIAECGVDIISIGALTHSAPAADVSLLISQSGK